MAVKKDMSNNIIFSTFTYIADMDSACSTAVTCVLEMSNVKSACCVQRWKEKAIEVFMSYGMW